MLPTCRSNKACVQQQQQQQHGTCSVVREAEPGLARGRPSSPWLAPGLVALLPSHFALTDYPHNPSTHHNPRLQVVKKLAKNGVKMIAMRCAGFDRVDLAACATHGIKVARVPTYSPTSVAEHAVSLLMALNRWGFRGGPFGVGAQGWRSTCGFSGV